MKEKKSSDHAILSASGSERWLSCPGSVKLSEGIPSVESDAGIRGTNTHTLLQFILENGKWEKLLKTREGKHFLKSIEYDGSMLSNALFAAKYVWSEKDRMEHKYGCEVQLMVEKKVELKGVGFGTSDIILYHPYGLLHVMDYKNGVKAVEPENNTQGLYYASAAADLFNWEFSDIHITIIQPNASHKKGAIRTWKTDEENLQRAYLRLQRGALATKKQDAPLVKQDDYCWFCPARQVCPLQMEVKDMKLLKKYKELMAHA